MAEELIDPRKALFVIEDYTQFLEDKGSEFKSRKLEKARFLQKYFSREDVGELDNGFKVLLYDEEKSLAERFDYALENIDRIGPGGISEILAHMEDGCALWNEDIKKSLKWLGVKDERLEEKNRDGRRYEKFCELCREALEEIRKLADDRVKDMYDLNMMLYFFSRYRLSGEDMNGDREFFTTGGNSGSKEVSEDIDEAAISQEERISFAREVLGENEVCGAEEKSPEEEIAKQEVREKLIDLGKEMGFEVKEEEEIHSDLEIFVLWQARTAKPFCSESRAWAFLIYLEGGKEKIILDMQKILHSREEIKKGIFVGQEKKIDTLKEETVKLSESFRQSAGFLSLKKLKEAREKLLDLKEVLGDTCLWQG